MSGRNAWVWGLLLLAVLALPPARRALEASMTAHMLLQIPLLVLAGALLVPCIPANLRRGFEELDAHGVAGMLMAAFASSYWMLPRALDAALSSPLAELAKFGSLPLLVGVPLALSWPRMGPIGRGFVLANAISMIAVVGWLYRESPVRLCSWYLVDQQVLLGNALLALALLAGAGWTLRAFAGPLARKPPPQAACRMPRST
jgi:hypothetical protein